MHKISLLGAGVSLAFTAFFGLTTPAATDDTLLDLDKEMSAAEVLADARAFRNGYFELHPAPFHSVAEADLMAAFDHIEASIHEPMTILDAWRLFSTVNPVLADAHAGIVIPGRSKIMKARLAAGERIFPLSVYFGEGNRLYVKLDNEANSGLRKDTEILSINGRDTGAVISDLLEHMRGDNPVHQRVLLERWFPSEYWALFGSSTAFQLEYAEGGETRTATVDGADTLKPASWAKPFGELFEYKILENSVGYLRVDTFDHDHKADFFALTEQAFKHFKEQNIETLIIDIRENGGGGNSMWQKGIMPYIADRPYRHVSSYTARVTEDNASEGDVIGEIQSGVYTTMTEPELDNPLRFKGKTYLMIGGMTYSSAIHFAITLQDYGIATIVGQPSGGRAGTTGNVTNIKLETTGLKAFAPVMLFSRPVRDGNESPVQPDILVPHHPDNPDRDIETLLQLASGK
ncbi:MAG: hypothetical protein HWE25_16410 [Alphaproteobacteria bacterium]|nr:hypothetical protein [Alphaproteobacteria bacterium]